MASITLRRTNRGTVHQVRVRVRGYPAQSAVFERKTDAVRWGQRTEAALRERRHFPGAEERRHTVAEAIDRYLDELPHRNLRDEASRRRQLAWWRQRIGHLRLADLTPAVIAEQRDFLLRTPVFPNRKTIKQSLPPRSAATVRRYLASLSPVLTLAERDWGWLNTSPMKKVAKPPEPRGRVRYLSTDEIRRLLGACRDSASPALLPIVVLAIATGMRRGEILGLDWSRVDLEQGLVTLVETKNGERRIVPVVRHALELLRERRERHGRGGGLVFSGQDPRKPLDVKKAWTTAVRRAGLQDFRFHDLRHTTASHMAMQGCSLLQVGEVLGHKTMQMVKRYAHLSIANSRHNLDRLHATILDGALSAA